MSARTLPARHPVVLHLAGTIAVPVCLAAGAFELWRARSGNDLSWGYAVEWPLIAGYVVHMWIRLARERRPDRVAPTAPTAALGGATVPAPTGSGGASTDHGPAAAVGDPQLAAWQQYLARLHAADPPGGPPTRRTGR
jgi:hypothetical protein